MEGSDLSYRWDLVLRYQMIEIIALWEGRLITNHLQSAFKISRSQASKVIKQYNAEAAEGNLEYDGHIKGYIPSDSFIPKFTQGDINEYLNLMDRQSESASHFAGSLIEQTNLEMVSPLHRNINPKFVRSIMQACREHLRVEIEYASLTSAKDYRNIVPHTLVFNGYRWHVRAYCEKSGQFRDFVLSRMTDIYDFAGTSEKTREQDVAWNTDVSIVIKPDSRLRESQQAVIGADFNMQNGSLTINTRGAMVQYILQFLRVSTSEIKADPKAQQVVIENIAEVKKWLFD